MTSSFQGKKGNQRTQSFNPLSFSHACMHLFSYYLFYLQWLTTWTTEIPIRQVTPFVLLDNYVSSLSFPPTLVNNHNTNPLLSTIHTISYISPLLLLFLSHSHCSNHHNNSNKPTPSTHTWKLHKLQKRELKPLLLPNKMKNFSRTSLQLILCINSWFNLTSTASRYPNFPFSFALFFHSLN